jgi:hypothetical protein
MPSATCDKTHPVLLVPRERKGGKLVPGKWWPEGDTDDEGSTRSDSTRCDSLDWEKDCNISDSSSVESIIFSDAPCPEVDQDTHGGVCDEDSW